MIRPDARDSYNPDPAYVKDLVDSLPYTQAELAERLGCTDRTIRLWIAGQRTISYPAQYVLECLVFQSE